MSRTLLVKSLFILAFFLPVSASALTISPTKIEVAVDPGQTAIGEIEVFNEQSEVKTFYTSFENFEPRGETGAPYFTDGKDGLATWITNTESFEIRPGEKIVIPYTITVPKDVSAGGYFAGIFFGTQPPSSNGGSEVAIGGKVGSLVLLRVNGEISEEGGLLDFIAGDKELFFDSLPVSFTYRFNNNGGDRVVPKGQITIKNSFFQTAAELPVNATEGSVLPNSIRKFETTWSDGEGVTHDGFFAKARYQLLHFHFGIYKAVLDVSWGDSNQHGSTNLWIVIFPWQLLIITGIVLVVLFQGLRFYNKLIIRRASK